MQLSEMCCFGVEGVISMVNTRFCVDAAIELIRLLALYSIAVCLMYSTLFFFSRSGDEYFRLRGQAFCPPPFDSCCTQVEYLPNQRFSVFTASLKRHPLSTQNPLFC